MPLFFFVKGSRPEFLSSFPYLRSIFGAVRLGWVGLRLGLRLGWRWEHTCQRGAGEKGEKWGREANKCCPLSV